MCDELFVTDHNETFDAEKPLEHDDEEVDINDPHCFYWVYICTKNGRLVHQYDEKIRNKSKPKPKKPTKERAPNPL